MTADAIEKEALAIIDRLPTLPSYEKEITGILKQDAENCSLLEVAGPGLKEFVVRAIVQEREGKKRRFPVLRDPNYPDFFVIPNAPQELGGRYSNPTKAFEAVEAFLHKEGKK